MYPKLPSSVKVWGCIDDPPLSSGSCNHYPACCRNRLGIRLQGPRPQFARKDGGEGGSHPSNVHDHVYAIGTINFTGILPQGSPCWAPLASCCLL